jgi:hypothetical protein
MRWWYRWIQGNNKTAWISNGSYETASDAIDAVIKSACARKIEVVSIEVRTYQYK